MCKHRGKLYVAGQFNRFGDEEVRSFVVLDEEDGKVLWAKSMVGANSRLEFVKEAPNENYLGAVTSMVCEENDDMIYLAGMFKNVTNQWTEADLEEFRKKEMEDDDYVRPDNPELIVNNIVKFNTTSKKFHTLASDSGAVGVINSGQQALLRTIECVGKGLYKCDEMYLGGFFSSVFGTPVAGLAKVTWLSNSTHQQYSLESVETVSSISSGIVTTVTQLTPDLLFYGGIFGPEDGTGEGVKAPIVLKHSVTGTHCPINVKMQHLVQCQGKKPPFLCCDNFYGAVFDSIKVGPTEFLVGGDFSNPLELENYNPVVPIPDGFPGGTPDTPENPFDVSRRLVDSEPELGLGYQHLVLLPIPTYNEDGSLKEQNVTTRWVGGPSGPVIDVSCREWNDDGSRCTDILVSGEFQSWIEFEIGADLDVTEKIVLYCPERMVSLKWIEDGDFPYYEPQNVIDVSSLNDDSRDFLENFHDDLEGKVSATLAYNDTVLAGGSFKWSNNLYVFKDASVNATIDSLPAIAESPQEGDMFYNCMKNAANAGLGRMHYDGASFCCRSGSWCPKGRVDIPCPHNWGYYCGSNFVNVCPEGYFCKTPGVKTICPVGYICLQGAIKPTKCAWFELCREEGLARPEKNSGFIFAAFVLGFLGVIVFVGSRYDTWSKRRGRKFIEKHFAERFNAFVSSGKDAREAQMSADATEMVRTGSSLGYNSDKSEGGSEDADSSRGSFVTPQKENRVDLTFRNLTVTLANGLKILNGVSGELKAGTMTAIMGPSGCGKSTLMNALTNRIRDGGKVGGDIYVNGEKKHLMSIAHVVGFVPQEDIMHRDLTVRENLRFYLRLKGDPTLNREQRRSFLNEIIDILGLGHVQHSLIGDELRRGVSGGQRKRVNIAIELISSPLLLFLDEPTSGLDATTSQALIDSLEKLTNIGLTVAMVIHQPRMELMNKIENLILLQRGGLPVYVGPTAKGLDYFNGYLGLQMSSLTSPADFYLDIITLDQKTDGDGNRLLKLTQGEDLTKCWTGYVEKYLKEEYSNEPTPLPLRQIPTKNRPGRLAQTKVYYIRSVRQILNNKGTFLIDTGLLIFSGLLTGFVAKNVMVGNQMVMTVNGLIGIMNALRVFGPEKAIFRREMQSGISSFAYFFGKSLSQLPITFLTPFFFMATYYRLAFPDLTFWDLYFSIVACLLSATGIGYFLSLLVDPQNAMISGVVFGLVAIMTCGMNPTLRDLESTAFGSFMCKLTYGPNMMSALFTKSAIRYFKAGFSQAIGVTYRRGYHEISGDDIFTEEQIYEAKQVLYIVVQKNLWGMIKQCATYMALSYVIIVVRAKKEIGGIFAQVAQGRSVRVIRGCCEAFWLGRRKTRIDEEEDLDDETVHSGDENDSIGAKQRSVKKIKTKTDDVVRSESGP
eukprot:CAMPEP_0118644358 /NCGR_PEP_ID=MMETSP0785-20121206/6903_1 /TAXON_ID=91992 /ORGANISM="Bolidomonas pacifica, Strain CCMP 1866" /LENGTH=1398 /DNA_ID=CAMNT_0006536125 /DNA_START=280 /DNA_END=4473 /DNA_ORIENTATION=+